MPVRSRHGLTRCAVCRAHIQAGDRPSTTDCPFCGANLARTRPTFRSLPGRSGAIAASLLAFSATACGASEPKPEPTAEERPNQNRPVEDPPPRDDFDQDTDEAVMVEAYGVAPDDDEPPVQSDEPVPVPAYGVIPAPDDFEDRRDDPPDEPMYGVAP